MNKKTISALIGGTALLGFGFVAAAQTSTGPVRPQYEIPSGSHANDDGPRGVMLQDGVAFYPKVGLWAGHDDNLFQTSSNKKSSAFYGASPGFKIQARNESGLYTFDVDSALVRYQSSSSDNYADYTARGTAEFVMGASLGLRLGVDYNRGHDARGTTDRTFANRPDVFRNTGPSMLVAYGANDARGRVEFEAGSFQKRYQNNPSTTVGSNRDNENIAGRFFMRIAPKTSFLVEARNDKYDYTLFNSQQDSWERRYLAGVTWEATAATSGTIKAGRIEKNFRSSAIKDFSGTGWEAAINWAPITYSKFDFYTAKTFSESTGFGDFALSKRYGANWTHGWNSKLSTTASVNRSEDEFVNSARNDTTDTLGFKVNYKVYRGVTVGGEYNYTDRDSSIAGFRFKRSIYMLTLGATL